MLSFSLHTKMRTFVPLISTLFFVFAAIDPCSAQPKAVLAKIQSLKASGLYVFANGEGADEEQARQQGRQNLVKLIKLQYGVPENSGIQKTADDLEAFRPISRSGTEIVTEEVTWNEKKKGRAIVFARKEVAKTIAVNAATCSLRDEEEFVFGEFTDRDANRASNEAKSNLIAQIQQRVETDRSVVTEENRSTTGRGAAATQSSSSESYRSQSRVFSRMTLLGLKTISLNIEGDTYVFAYITKPDIEKSFEPVKQKILGMVQEGEERLSTGNLGLGLSALFRAYVLCDAYFTTLPYSFKDGKRTQDVRTAVENRLNQLIDSLQLKASPAYDMDERNTVVPFTATFRGQPIQGLGYILEYGSYTAAGNIAQGTNLIELANFIPESRVSTLRPKIVIDIRDQMATDEMLAELAPSRLLAPQKELPVDFSNLFKFQIGAAFEGYTVKFTVQPRFTSMIKLVKWDFGDGASDTRPGLQVTHTYDEMDVYKVRAWVNGDTLLSETRFLDFSGKRIRMTPPKAAATSFAKVETPVETVIPEVVAYQELAGIQTTQGLLTTIQALSKRGQIVFGSQKTLGDSEGALVLVVDDKNVVDRLIFSGNRYFQMSSREPVTNLSERYAGKRLIWVKKS